MCNEKTDLKYKPNLCPDCGEKLGCSFWQNSLYWVMWCPRCDQHKWIKKRHTESKPRTRNISRALREVIEFNETAYCQITIPKATYCHIKIKGSQNYIEVTGDQNISICDKHVFHGSHSSASKANNDE